MGEHSELERTHRRSTSVHAPMTVRSPAPPWRPRGIGAVVKRASTIAAAVLLLGATTTRCEHPRAYFTDRRRDTADIFTLTVGFGAGAHARIGPFHAGLVVFVDQFGLRGGVLVKPSDFHGSSWYSNSDTLDLTVTGGEDFRIGDEGRYKQFDAGIESSFPMVTLVDYCPGPHPPAVLPYYTEVEVIVALIGGVRVGVNSGEALDFLLGWFGIDIYNDDVEMRGMRLQEEQTRAEEQAALAPRASPTGTTQVGQECCPA